MIVSHLECQSLIKDIKKCQFFVFTSHIFPSKILDCNLIIKKIDMIIFINGTLLMIKVGYTSHNN
jgi:hypothetical protein